MENTCDKCYLSIFNKRTAGRGEGCTPTPAKSILFISESPTITDIKNNDLLTGRSTKLLSQFIEDYKLTYWTRKTTLIQCYCPRFEEIYAEKCFPNLVKTIQEIKPTIIVAVGKSVYKFLKDENNINMKRVVNKVSIYSNSILIPIYNPVKIIRDKCQSEYVKSFQLISNIFSDVCREYKWIKPEF